MARTGWPRRSLLVAVALATATCGQALLTAPPGSTIALSANPEKIPAFGGVSVISALVVESTGQPVADGTVVQFFTTLGQIPEQGQTNDGVVRVELRSDGRSGDAKITGFSGGGAGGGSTPSPAPGNTVALSTSASLASGDTVVHIGAIVAKRITLTVNPARLIPPRRDADVVATVYDDDGNPLPAAAVAFSVTEENGTDPAKFESLESAGAPRYTDNNGRAYDRLLTRYNATGVVRYVAVGAATSTTAGAALAVDPKLLVQIN